MRIRLKFRLDDQVVYGCFSSVQRLGASSAVLYTPQDLTDEEKTQARENIGAQDPNLLVVTVDGNYKASHTASEINTFVQGGGSAVLVWFSNVFNPKIITAAKCQFGTMFNSAKGATEWVLDVDASGTVTFSAIECGALKNPNAITFTGAVSAIYDGSKPVEVEIPTPQSVDIPEALPNPNAITFTGAVKATYDGSKPVEVEIPEGGGGGNSVYFTENEPPEAQTGDFWYDESEGESEEANADYIPVPQSANIGQTIVVKAVDENGKPTEWEAVDLPSGGSSGGINPLFLVIKEIATNDGVETAELISGTYAEAFEAITNYMPVFCLVVSKHIGMEDSINFDTFLFSCNYYVGEETLHVIGGDFDYYIYPDNTVEVD